MADAAELRELEDDELYVRLADGRRELLNLRFQLATGQLDNAARIGLVKKDVARILTLLRDREIALAEGRDASPVLRPVRDLEERPPRRRPRAQEDEDEVGDEDVSDTGPVEDFDESGDDEEFDEALDADADEAEEDK